MNTKFDKIIGVLIAIVGCVVILPSVLFFFRQDPKVQDYVFEDFVGGSIVNKQAIIRNVGFKEGVYGLYLEPESKGELIYKFVLKYAATDWSWLYLDFNGIKPFPGKVSISIDGKDYTAFLENRSVKHKEDKFDIKPYIKGSKKFFLKFESRNDKGKNVSFVNPESLSPPILSHMMLKIFSEEPPIPPSPVRTSIGFFLLAFGFGLIFINLKNFLPISLIIIGGLYLRLFYLSKVIYTFFDSDAQVYKIYADKMSLWPVFSSNGFYSGDFGGREPFFPFVVKLFYAIFGSSDTHMQLLTLLLSLVSIYLTYKVGRALFGKFIGLISSSFMAFNIPLIIESTRGLRLELEMVLILLLIYILFCHNWQSLFKGFSLAGLIGGMLVLTRFTDISGVIVLVCCAALIKSKTNIKQAFKLACLAIFITIVLFLPHKYGIYKLHGGGVS